MPDACFEEHRFFTEGELTEYNTSGGIIYEGQQNSLPFPAFAVGNGKPVHGIGLNTLQGVFKAEPSLIPVILSLSRSFRLRLWACTNRDSEELDISVVITLCFLNFATAAAAVNSGLFSNN